MASQPPQFDEKPDSVLPGAESNEPRKDDGNPAPSADATQTLAASPSHFPKRIGHYHIKRVIASGGMGTVYEATQKNPRRTVALKLMKHGIASKSALRRFEYESQILARLHHPGIAQIYEAGTHRDDTGTVPYFAMEYIPNAVPITKYAQKRISLRERNWSCSPRFAMPSTTATRRESSTAILSRATS